MEIDIKKLALLARIKLEDGEEEKLKKDFEGILGYVEKLKSADLTRTDAELTLTEVGAEKDGLVNVTREDEVTNEPGKYSEDLLQVAPAKEKGYVKVKGVFK